MPLPTLTYLVHRRHEGVGVVLGIAVHCRAERCMRLYLGNTG